MLLDYRTGSAEGSGYYSHTAGRIRQLDRQNYRVKLDMWLVQPLAAGLLRCRCLSCQARRA